MKNAIIIKKKNRTDKTDLYKREPKKKKKKNVANKESTSCFTPINECVENTLNEREI